MILALHGAKEHSATLSELAKHLGLKPYEAGCKEIIEKLVDDAQAEIDRYYMPFPFDGTYQVINIGDNLDVGTVVGVGDGYVYVADTPEGAAVGYIAHDTRHDNGERLLKTVRDAVEAGALTDAQTNLIIDYVKGCYDVG